MGETTNRSLAGKVIKLCNVDKNSPLFDLFEIPITATRKSKLKTDRIRIVEVVKSLSKIIEEIREENSNLHENASKILNKKIEKDPENIIKNTKSLLDGFFKKLKEVFSADWREKSKSLILKTKYIAALILLLKDFLEDKSMLETTKSMKEYGKTFFLNVKKRLQRLKENIKQNTDWKNSEKNIPVNEREIIFHPKREGIPPVRYSTKKIYESLKHYLTTSETHKS